MLKIRYNQIDYAKFIAIFLVILGHVIFQNINSKFNLNLLNLIYSFHIPLFFILSGLNLGLSIDNSNQTNKKDYKKLFDNLLFPYLIWSFLYIIIFYFQLPCDYFGVNTVGEKIYLTISLHGISPLWFLSTLFIGKIIFIFIIKRKFFYNYSKISHTLFLLVIITISNFINTFFQPYPSNLDIVYAYPIIAICRVLPALFFLDIGFLLSNILVKYLKTNFKFKVLIFILNLLIIYLFRNIFFYKNFLYVFIIQDMKSFFITGILGSFSIISLCCLLNKEIKIITDIGKRTMDIMALHSSPIPIYSILSHIFIFFNLKKSLFIFSISLLIICYIISRLICDKMRLYISKKNLHNKNLL